MPRRFATPLIFSLSPAASLRFAADIIAEPLFFHNIGFADAPFLIAFAMPDAAISAITLC